MTDPEELDPEEEQEYDPLDDWWEWADIQYDMERET